MSGTDLVLRMSRAALPANRPIDHARRASAALAAGFLFGAVVGMLLFIDEVPLLRMLWVLIPAVALGLIAAAFWWVWIPARGEPIPVVARVVGTNESTFAREVHSGGGRGILVPVVALPVGGGAPFSTMVTFRSAEPPVGALLPLFQVEPGLGELVEGSTTTPAQRELIDKIVKRPKLLPNKAEILPVRRGPLERTPLWAAVEWWACAGGAAFAAMLFVGSLRG